MVEHQFPEYLPRRLHITCQGHLEGDDSHEEPFTDHSRSRPTVIEEGPRANRRKGKEQICLGKAALDKFER